MIILGIDPGYERLGIAVVEKLPRTKEVLIYSDCFKTSAKIAFHLRLLMLGQEIERIIKKYKIDGLAIENLFLSTNQKTAMRVSEVRGMIIYLAIKNGLDIKEFTPLQIKSAITGHGKSDKNSMIKMIPLLIGIKKHGDKHQVEKISDDEYDAIGAALTYLAFPQILV